MNYYLIFVKDDIEPEIRGPFPNRVIRDDYARELKQELGADHGYFPLDIDSFGKPEIDSYSGGFMEGAD